MKIHSASLIFFKKYDCAIDLWAAGCIVAGSIFQKLYIFDGATISEQLLKIVQILGWKELSAYAREFKIKKVKEFERKLRWYGGTGFEKFKADGCVTNEAIDLVKKLLTYNPKKRLTASEAMKHPYFAVTNEKYGSEIKNALQSQSIEQVNAQLFHLPVSNQNGYFKCVIGDKIGSGAYGEVYYAKHVNSGLEFAVKSLKVAPILELKHELGILKKLRGSPNINHLRGSIMGAVVSLYDRVHLSKKLAISKLL